MAKTMRPLARSGGGKQISMEEGGKKPPSPLMALSQSSKKDYAKKPKEPSMEMGASPFGMTGLREES